MSAARLAALILGVALTVTPSAAQRIPARPEALRLPPLRFEVPSGGAYRHRLASGIPVYVVEDHTLPLVDISIALPVGGFLDPPGKIGLASLTGALLRRGGTRDLTADALDEEVDFLALDLESVAGERRSGIRLDTATEALGRGLELWADVLLRPRFQADRLETTRASVLAGLEARNDDPGVLLEREWAGLLYGSQAARPVTPATMAAIERSDLVAFHRRYWVPHGAVIAVSGDVDAASIVARLNRLLSGWTGTSPPPPRMGGGALAAPPGAYHVEHSTAQVKLAFGHRTRRRTSWQDPDEPALALLTEILGGGGTISRLRSRLRGEAGLVYRAEARCALGMESDGEFRVTLEMSPESVPRAITMAFEEMHRLRREAVSEEELTLAKKALLDGFPLLFENAEEIAGRFAEDQLLGRPHSYWTGYRERLRRVTPTGVLKVARRYLRPAELRVLLVGPWAELEAAGADRTLESLVGKAVQHLPRRDPRTWQPVSLPGDG